MRFGNFIEQATEPAEKKDAEDPRQKRLKMIKRQVLMKKVQAVRQGGGEDITASHEPEGEMVEGVGDAVKKGLKRHKDAVEKKKIKNRKAVPYAALAAEHQPEGDELNEYSPNVTYQAKGGKKSGKLGKSSVYSLRDKDESKKDFRKSHVKDIKDGLLKKEEVEMVEELSRRSKPSAKAKMAKLDAILKRREERKIAEKQALKTEGWLGKKKEEKKKPQKAMDAGARAKRKLQRREYAAKVSGSEDNVPDEMREGVAKAAGNALGYAARVGAGIVGAGVQALSQKETIPKVSGAKKGGTSSAKQGSISAAQSQAEKAKKAKMDARKKAIKKIKDDRRERATNIMTAEKAAKKVKKEGEDKKFKADSTKPIVAEFVNNLWEASHKCKNCGKVYTGKSCSCGC